MEDLLKELHKELEGYFGKADLLHGVHKRVHGKKIYSQNAVLMHRRGESLLKDPKKVKKLLDAYEKEVLKVFKKLKVTEAVI